MKKKTETEVKAETELEEEPEGEWEPEDEVVLETDEKGMGKKREMSSATLLKQLVGSLLCTKDGARLIAIAAGGKLRETETGDRIFERIPPSLARILKGVDPLCRIERKTYEQLTRTFDTQELAALGVTPGWKRVTVRITKRPTE